MARHAKTDSDITSLAASSPPRSPRRPIYYVMSPSGDAEKMSFAGLSPAGSPLHHHHSHHRYASSPIHHSRESSTTRFSASLKNGYWRKVPDELQLRGAAAGCDDDDDDDEEDDESEERWGLRCYAVIFLLGFFVLFSLFSLILWASSKAYEPKITIKSMVFSSYNIQAGIDLTGVPTKMISINSTVRIWLRNPATFFGVHVSSSPLDLYYYDLVVASGHMKEFYASRKSERVVATAVVGVEVPLYGGGSVLTSRSGGGPPAVVPLSLRFVVRARADVLGKLVRSRFHRRVRCSVQLLESRLGRPVDIRRACDYE